MKTFAYVLALTLCTVAAVGCQPDATDRPSPDTSQGEEFGDPDAEEAASSGFEPIDPNTPEERTPTVTAPPETPPPPEPGPPPGPESSGQ